MNKDFYLTSKCNFEIIDNYSQIHNINNVNPIVSIVIPVYNDEKFIYKTLKSASSQTLKELEIICIDDKSTDQSEKVIVKYMKKDSRVKLIKLEKNLKTSVARNIGISYAAGEFILPLDSDDILDSEYCEKAINIFRNDQNISVVYCKANKFNKEKAWLWNLPIYDKKLILDYNMVFCSAFYRKSDWEKFGGYNSNMKEGLEDWDFWLNFTENNLSFYRIPEVLFHYRQVNASRNDFDKKNAKALKKIIISNHPVLYKYNKVREILKFLFEMKYSSNGYFRVKIFKIQFYKYYKKGFLE